MTVLRVGVLAKAVPPTAITIVKCIHSVNTSHQRATIHSSYAACLLFWHGVSDPWLSALDTVDYYERMAKANGSPERVRDWSRLFLVPGAGHCG